MTDKTKLNSMPVAILDRGDIVQVLMDVFGLDEKDARRRVYAMSDGTFTACFGKDEWQGNEGFMDTFWIMVEYLIEESDLLHE